MSTQGDRAIMVFARAAAASSAAMPVGVDRQADVFLCGRRRARPVRLLER
jgi:hypothetical protein